MAGLAGRRIVTIKSLIISLMAVVTALVVPTLAAASITFVAAGPLAHSRSPVTTLTIGLPAGVQSGDTLLAQVVLWDANGSDVPTAPSGWTAIRHDAISNGNKITTGCIIRWRCQPTASYTWSLGSQYAAGIRAHGVAPRYRHWTGRREHRRRVTVRFRSARRP